MADGHDAMMPWMHSMIAKPPTSSQGLRKFTAVVTVGAAFKLKFNPAVPRSSGMPLVPATRDLLTGSLNHAQPERRNFSRRATRHGPRDGLGLQRPGFAAAAAEQPDFMVCDRLSAEPRVGCRGAAASSESTARPVGLVENTRSREVASASRRESNGKRG